jgi:hypothetical protein
VHIETTVLKGFDSRFGFAVVGVNGNRYSWIIYALRKTSSLGYAC